MQQSTGRRNISCKAVAELGLGAQGLEQQGCWASAQHLHLANGSPKWNPRTFGALQMNTRAAILPKRSTMVFDYGVFQDRQFCLERLSKCHRFLNGILAKMSCDCPGLTLYPIIGAQPLSRMRPNEVGELRICDRCCNASSADPMGLSEGQTNQGLGSTTTTKRSQKGPELGSSSQSLTPS